MKIIMVFKTHFDIGFTRLASEIIAQYSGEMLSDVIDTCNGTADMGKLRYVWTMPAWPLRVMQGCEPEKRKELDRLVGEGQISFHALPFTYRLLRYGGCVGGYGVCLCSVGGI